MEFHRKKIEEYPGKNYALIEYWKGEVKEIEEQKQQKENLIQENKPEINNPIKQKKEKGIYPSNERSEAQ